MCGGIKTKVRMELQRVSMDIIKGSITRLNLRTMRILTKRNKRNKLIILNLSKIKNERSNYTKYK